MNDYSNIILSSTNSSRLKSTPDKLKYITEIYFLLTTFS